jgi:hypothetical protein
MIQKTKGLKMRDLTNREIEAINNDYWAGGRPACPACGSILTVIRGDALGYPKDMTINCPGCGVVGFAQSAPEKGGVIEPEAAYSMVQLFLRKGEPVCPLDGTKIRVERHGVLDGRDCYEFFLTCPRCGADAQVNWISEVHG